MLRPWIVVLILLAAAPCFAQQGAGNECTPTGTWYGGSIVAYQMTIVPSAPAGHYAVFAEGMYKNSVMNTTYSGHLVKKGDVYEGSILSLTTGDPDFLNPPPIFKMPDLVAAWISLRMDDCNNITNTIPFFGLYSAGSIWGWGPVPVWLDIKVPLVDPPDLDLLNVLAGGDPVVEVYRRLPNGVNPSLLHK